MTNLDENFSEAFSKVFGYDPRTEKAHWTARNSIGDLEGNEREAAPPRGGEQPVNLAPSEEKQRQRELWRSHVEQVEESKRRAAERREENNHLTAAELAERILGR